MHKFLARVQLHDNSSGSYEDLHGEMIKESFTKELPRTFKKDPELTLLQGEYYLTTDDKDPQHALDRVCRACVKSRATAAILVTKVARMTGMSRMRP